MIENIFEEGYPSQAIIDETAEAMLEDMKVRMKHHPEIQKVLKNMMNDGIDEDDALGIMILAWLEHDKRRWL